VLAPLLVLLRVLPSHWTGDPLCCIQCKLVALAKSAALCCKSKMCKVTSQTESFLVSRTAAAVAVLMVCNVTQ
jgi:hypothetical protein